MVLVFRTWVHISHLRSVPSGDGPVLLGSKESHPAGVVLARRSPWIKCVLSLAVHFY